MLAKAYYLKPINILLVKRLVGEKSMVQPIFEKITYSQNTVTVKEQIKVNASTNVQSQEVESIISVCPFATLEKESAQNGKINFNGKSNFYICYLDNEKNLKKCEAHATFDGTISDEKIKENATISTKLVVDKTSSQTDGNFLSVTAYLTLTFEQSESVENNALTGGEGLHLKTKQVEVCKGLGVRKTTYPIEEQIDLPYQVEQVIYHGAQAVITAVQSGVGSIIVDGQVLLSLVLLQNSQKSDIIRIEKALPYRMEIECEEAIPNMVSVARVKEKSIKTDIQVDQTNAQSTANVSISLEFEGQTFITDTLLVADDVFSTTNYLDTEVCASKTAFNSESFTTNCSLVGRANVIELPLSSTLITIYNEKACVISHQIENQCLTLNGVYTAVALFNDGEKVFARQLEIPFEKAVEGNFSTDYEYELCLTTNCGMGKIVSATSLEVQTQAYLTCYPVKTMQCTYVKGVTVAGVKEQKQCAISVYLAQGGEQLFALAKRLNESPENLAKNNADLQFPLAESQRVVVYRQKQ